MEKKKDGVSRQTLWQRKHRAMGLCVVCSEPAYKGWRCVKHYEQHKIVMRLRYIPRVRGRYDVGGGIEFLEAARKANQKLDAKTTASAAKATAAGPGSGAAKAKSRTAASFGSRKSAARAVRVRSSRA
jgi:hypothetical protein